MGTRAIFGQSSYPMMDEIPDVLNQTVVAALLENRSIPAALVKAHVGYGLDRYLARFHTYAADTYHYGLPEGNVPSYTVNLTTLRNVLVGLPVNAGEVVTNVTGSVETVGAYTAQAYEDIASFYPAFTPVTPAIDITLGSEYDASKHSTKKGVVRKISSVRAIEHPTDSTKSYVGVWVQASALDDRSYSTSTYAGDGDYDVSYSQILIHTLPYLTPRKTIVAVYEHESAPGIPRYWSYTPTSGTDEDIYPELAFFNELDTIDSGYFPVIPLRIDTVNMGEGVLGAGTPEYDTSKELLDIISIDIDDIVTQLNVNPDIGLIDDAFVTFQANLYSKEPAVMQYLFKQFEAIEAASLNQSYIIKESDLQNEIEFNYIRNELELITASPSNPIGSYTTSWQVLPDTQIPTGRTLYKGSDDDIAYAEMETLYNSTFTVQHQISTSVARVITVYGLILNIQATSRNGAYTKQLIQPITNDEEFQGNFNIPLSRNVLNTMTGIEQHERDKVIYASLRINVISAQYEKTSFWRSLLKILSNPLVQFFLAVITFGASEVFTVTMAAVTAGTVTLSAAIWFLSVVILKKIVISMIIDYAVAWIAKTIGGTLGMILSAVAAAFAVVYTSGGMDKLKGIMNIPGSKELVLAVNSIQRGVDAGVEAEYDVLNEEQAQWEKELSAAEEALDTARGLLGDEGLFYNPLYESRNTAKFIQEETPTQFFTRTIHTPNPGVLSLGTIGYYVDNALLLPKQINRGV